MDAILVKGAKNSSGSSTGDDPSGDDENTDFTVVAIPNFNGSYFNGYNYFIYCNNSNSKYAVSFPQRGFANISTLSSVSLSCSEISFNGTAYPAQNIGSRLSIGHNVYKCVCNFKETGLFKTWLLTSSPEKEKEQVAKSIETKFYILKTNTLHQEDYNTKLVVIYKKIIMQNLGRLSSFSGDNYDFVWNISGDPEEQNSVSFTIDLRDYVYYDGSHENYRTYGIGCPSSFSAFKSNTIPSLSDWGIK